jgi:phosphoglycerate dehydrogenase-like enzyme
MDPVKVLVTLRRDTDGSGLNWAFQDRHLEQIRAVSSRLDVLWRPCRSIAEMVPLLKDVEVLHTMYGAFPIDCAPRLRWVHINTASLDRLKDQPILNSDVLITNNSGVYDVNVAEHVLMLMLALARRLPVMHRWQLDARWPDREEIKALSQGRGGGPEEDLLPQTSALRPLEVFRKTVGIVGYGSIGRQLARLLVPFRTRILAIKRRPHERRQTGFVPDGVGDPEGTLPHAWFGPDQIREMFPLCDFVVLVQPSTPETVGMIGEAELRALPRHAFLINVGRGNTVDEPALLRALQEGWIAGAGLDVFCSEPLDASSPWYRLPNVIVTPHLAGASERDQDRSAQLFCENLRRYLAGEPLLNVIDKALRY